MIRDKIARITTAFEEGLFNKYINNIQDENFNDFEELANTYSADLTLFDVQGVQIISTQPKNIRIWPAGKADERPGLHQYAQAA